MTTTTVRATPDWRTPVIIIMAGCVCAALSFGPRSVLGMFQTPLLQTHGWGREVFSFALALQNLMWGAAQPFAGALADRFGSLRVLWAGGLLYALGLVTMAYGTTPGMLDVSAGLLIGFGLAGSSFNIVLAALGKLVPEEWRSLAFGCGTAAGSFGQFVCSPLAVFLIDSVGWQNGLVFFAALMVFVIPAALVLRTQPNSSAKSGFIEAGPSSARAALREALGHRSYQLLVLGYFTCGFQLAFITTHLPAYLIDVGMPAWVGGYTIASIGLFNIVGSLSSGYLGGRLPRRYILSVIYFIRAAAIFGFIMAPISITSCLVFGAVMGLMWLSTIPPTNGLVALMFGTRWLAMLSGFSFFSHQVGGFLGVLIGGYAYARTGSYELVWWLSIFLGIFSALINLPIVEKPVSRPAVAAG